jgi:hypothetical protein
VAVIARRSAGTTSIGIGMATRAVRVWGDYGTGNQDGDCERPYRTVAQGLEASSAGQRVIVYAGRYPESFVFGGNRRLSAPVLEVL